MTILTKPLNKTTRQRGFTLIEILVALAILSVIALLASNAFDGARSKAQAMVGLARQVADANLQLKTDTGCYVNKPMALVLNEEWWSAPVIQNELRESVVISNPGGFTVQVASYSLKSEAETLRGKLAAKGAEQHQGIQIDVRIEQGHPERHGQHALDPHQPG